MNQPILFPQQPFSKPAHWAKDICENKHGGNANSVKANPSPEKKEIDRKKLLRLIKFHVELDIHQLEILMGKSANKFSGRLSEMKADKEIKDGEDGKWRLA